MADITNYFSSSLNSPDFPTFSAVISTQIFNSSNNSYLMPTIMGGISDTRMFLQARETTTEAFYFQRIFDTGLSTYVYYKMSTITSTPNPQQTTPNHTNNLVASTHEIIAETFVSA